VDPTLGQKITVKTFHPNRDADIDNDQEKDMEYWPHKGEEWPQEDMENAPLVLLVEKAKSEQGEPWWHKETLEQLGLGVGSWQGKRVAIPNMTHYTSLAYKVKHLVRVIPVKFPHGEVPDEAEFDPQMGRMTDNGEFLYHPKIKANTVEIEAGMEKSEQLLITQKTYRKKASWDWKFSRDSPLGNSNYHRDTQRLKPSTTNRVTDAAYKIKY